MKKIFAFLVFTAILSINPSHSEAKVKRTDGPAGSEYGEFSDFEGDLSIGAQFGALIDTRSKGDSSFLLGLDGDYRPYDLFGVRLSFLQGLASPKSTLFLFTPLVHLQISNLKPYILFGPGLGILNRGGTTAKFVISGGLGADVELTPHLGIGMLWTFNSIFDSADAHSISARFSYHF